MRFPPLHYLDETSEMESGGVKVFGGALREFRPSGDPPSARSGAGENG